MYKNGWFYIQWYLLSCLLYFCQVEYRDQLLRQSQLFKARGQRLKIALEAAQAYNRVKPPHQTVGDAVMLAFQHAMGAAEKGKPSSSSSQQSPIVSGKVFFFCGRFFNTLFLSLHLHKIVKGLYFHSSLSVCLSGFLVNKIPAERMNQFGRSFR